MIVYFLFKLILKKNKKKFFNLMKKSNILCFCSFRGFSPEIKQNLNSENCVHAAA